jgi:GH24 family phage-related lysozyme (muramidase)
MNISQKGINLIKSYEGLMLHAYKPLPTEKYYTIGYGHYGSDVNKIRYYLCIRSGSTIEKGCRKVC